MANTFQGLRILTPTTIISNQPSYNTETSNLRTHSVNQNVQRWEATITLMAGGQYNKASTLLPHYLGNGQHKSFEFNIPQPSLIDGGAKDLPTGTIIIEDTVFTSSITVNDATTLTLTDASNFANSGTTTINSVVYTYTSKSGNVLTGTFTATDLTSFDASFSRAPIASDSEVTVTITNSDLNKVIPAGRFITFSNHSKVYMIAEEFKPTTLTGNTLKLVHILTHALTTSTTINYKDDDVNMTAKYSNNNNFSWTLSQNGNTTFTIYLIEDLI